MQQKEKDVPKEDVGISLTKYEVIVIVRMFIEGERQIDVLRKAIQDLPDHVEEVRLSSIKPVDSIEGGEE